MKWVFPIIVPTLAAFWIAFAFLSANAALDLDYPRLLSYAAVLSALVCSILLTAGRFFRPAAHPSVALAVAALIISSFQYDQVGALLRQVDVHSVRLQMGLWAFGALVAAGAAAWVGRFAVGRLSLMIGLAAMVTAALLQTALYAGGATDRADASALGSAPASAAQDETKRPVISLVLDTYARSDVLAEMYGVNNEGFESALAERGFIVAKKAMSNYPWTSLSMSSALEMEYMVSEAERRPYDSLHFARVTNGLNEAVSQFRARDYIFALFHAGRYRTTISCSGVEDVCLQCPGRFDEMELVLLEKTPVAHLLRKVAPTFYVALGGGDCPISTLPEKMRALGDGGFFLFGHHMALHDAMNVDAKCRPLDQPVPVTWPSTRHKRDMQLQIECINRQLLSLIDHVLAAYEDPIILLSGDHGFWTEGYESFKAEALWRRHAIFTAVRLPAACQGAAPQDLTPVNHYRLILACLAGRTPTLLPNRFFSVGFLEPEGAGSEIRVLEIDPRKGAP